MYRPSSYRPSGIAGRLAKAAVIAVAALLAFGGLNSASAATGAVAVTSVNLRAGPSTRYPVVMTMPQRASLSIYGCLADRSWCDVSWGASRGWVAASYIQVVYRGQPTVLTAAIVPAIGITTVAFSVSYWDVHYRSQPWYAQWDHYYPGGGSRSVAAGCGDRGCGAASVTRGPYGGGHAAIGGCNDDRCGGASVTRGPRGNTAFRHGGFDRP